MNLHYPFASKEEKLLDLEKKLKDPSFQPTNDDARFLIHCLYLHEANWRQLVHFVRSKTMKFD